MDGSSGRGTDRAMTEMTGAAILVAVTVVVTATVGLNVLLVEDRAGAPTNGEFEYRHISETKTLVVTYASGPRIASGKVLLVGPDGNVTWATLRDMDPDVTVSPGDTARLGSDTPYGEPVTTLDRLTIYYAENGTRTEIGAWQ